MRSHPPNCRRHLWVGAVLTAWGAACSAPTGGAPPQLTYTQASMAGEGGNNVVVVGPGEAIPFSSQPLASLNVDWTAFAMNNSNPHGVHLFTGLNAGVCLDVNNGRPTTGNTVHIYQCGYFTTAQLWTMVDGQLQIADANGTPFCLSLAGGSLNANAPITVACTPVGGTTDPTQLWRWEQGLLRLVDSDQCLSLTEDTPANSHDLATFPCDPNNTVQQWRIGNLGTGEGNIPVAIGARVGSRLDPTTCLDLRADDTQAGIVETYACNTSAAQKWVFEAGTIANQNNSCISIDGAATVGTNIKVAPCGRDDPKQQWTWSQSTFMLAGTDLCICTPPGAAPSSSPQLALGACPSSPSGSLNCQWLLGVP